MADLKTLNIAPGDDKDRSESRLTLPLALASLPGEADKRRPDSWLWRNREAG